MLAKCMYTLQPNRASTGLLALRLVAGIAMILHGQGKIQNPTGWMGAEATMPGFLQALAALSEFGGGIALILGLLVPLASFGLLCTMAVAVNVHMKMGDPFVATGPGKGSFEPAALYAAVAFLFLVSGAGTYSLDHVLFGRKPRE